MSQPRRRRRRRRRGGGSGASGGGQPAREPRQQARGTEDGREEGRSAESRSRRRRRRQRGGKDRQPSSPALSEDLVRAADRKRPETLTAPPDGTTLEQVIGELQSRWGVPQSPQEFRITVKVAEERSARAPGRGPSSDVQEPDEGERPRRERAPAAPRIASGDGSEREPAPGRRKRRGRRRRRRGGSGS
ncbi:MAG: hypothetical protein ACRDKB_12345 [Actinomycetota bacterium]